MLELTHEGATVYLDWDQSSAYAIRPDHTIKRLGFHTLSRHAHLLWRHAPQGRFVERTAYQWMAEDQLHRAFRAPGSPPLSGLLDEWQQKNMLTIRMTLDARFYLVNSTLMHLLELDAADRKARSKRRMQQRSRRDRQTA